KLQNYYARSSALAADYVRRRLLVKRRSTPATIGTRSCCGCCGGCGCRE
ncbi:MAG: hypothetical protein ACI8RC_002611, partial [Ilumatobacter sp.]